MLLLIERIRKASILLLIAMLAVLCQPGNACVLLYSGGDMTDDGANMYMRSEETDADANKVYYVSPAGKHLKGETYQGCTDFTWIFTHDSYKYTARCDGLIDGSCTRSHPQHP